MAKKVPATKSEIMAAVAEAAQISKKQAVAAYDALLAIAYAGANQTDRKTTTQCSRVDPLVTPLLRLAIWKEFVLLKGWDS